MNDVIRYIYEYPADIGRHVGFADLTDDLHNDWLRWFVFGDDDGLLLAHRNSYKTSCLALAIALVIILHPDWRIIFQRKTDEDVVEVLDMVSNIMRHPYFLAISERLWGCPVTLTENARTRLSVNIKRGISGAPNVRGFGISSSITGKHCEILFYDDIVNIKDRISKAERNNTKRIMQEYQNIRKAGGRLVGTGTPWHKDDAYSLIPVEQKHVYDYRKTGLIEDTRLAILRSSMTPSLFAANYELKHIADEDSIFKTEARFTTNADAIHDGVMHVDAAYGGSDGTAVTVVKKMGDGSYVAYGKRYEGHFSKHLSNIADIHKRMRAGTVWCEDNADKGFLRKELVALGIPAKGYHESTNKYVKISTIGLNAWPNTIWLSETDPDYLSEILDYTENAEHDDSPDSYASLIRQIDKPAAFVGLSRDRF